MTVDLDEYEKLKRSVHRTDAAIEFVIKLAELILLTGAFWVFGIKAKSWVLICAGAILFFVTIMWTMLSTAGLMEDFFRWWGRRSGKPAHEVMASPLGSWIGAVIAGALALTVFYAMFAALSQIIAAS